MTATTARQPKGIRVGGQFAATSHGEPDTELTNLISVPSNPRLYELVYEDRLSNGERRTSAREALGMSLAGDDFEIVHNAEARKGILAEADRDDSVDRAIDRIEVSEVLAHHFGAAVARELKDIRQGRLAVESHYVPTAADTFEAAAAHIKSSPAKYREALEQTFPYLNEQWFEALLQHQKLQPESWQRTQVHGAAVTNERLAAANLPRQEVSDDENPNFASHPVSALESRIDALIVAGGDPASDGNVRYLAQEEGAGYGTVNIKLAARARVAACRGRAEQD